MFSSVKCRLVAGNGEKNMHDLVKTAVTIVNLP